MKWCLRFVIGALAALAATGLVAQYGRVQHTLHNLSVSGPGDVRSPTETEVCKFCHIPHSAVANEPLWGRQLSEFQPYETAPLRSNGESAPAPQPDGSSRLCLSCHDGTVALGDIGGKSRQGLQPGRGLVGTDLSGSHPISFVMRDRDEAQRSGRDMDIRPVAAIEADPDVRLDARGKMQCTTCHDPHADRYYAPGRTPRFWVKTTVTGVCLTCHELR